MPFCSVYPLESFDEYRYVVVFVREGDHWVFPRHKNRSTFETAGGHIERGETPLEAAKRELYEETGALEFTVWPLFDYRAGDEKGEAAGVVFYADVTLRGAVPEEFEMAEARVFEDLPQALTYPAITPVLFEAVTNWLAQTEKE